MAYQVRGKAEFQFDMVFANNEAHAKSMAQDLVEAFGGKVVECTAEARCHLCYKVLAIEEKHLCQPSISTPEIELCGTCQFPLNHQTHQQHCGFAKKACGE